jgi:hypothetical protein
MSLFVVVFILGTIVIVRHLYLHQHPRYKSVDVTPRARSARKYREPTLENKILKMASNRANGLVSSQDLGHLTPDVQALDAALNQLTAQGYLISEASWNGLGMSYRLTSSGRRFIGKMETQ